MFSWADSILQDVCYFVRGLARNRIFLFGIGPALLLLVGVIYWALNAGAVSTDDATVSAARVAISSRSMVVVPTSKIDWSSATTAARPSVR